MHFKFKNTLSELSIPIDLQNPVAFFGINDSNLELIRKKFPAFKIIARGNEIKILGDESQLQFVAQKIAEQIPTILNRTNYRFFSRLASQMDDGSQIKTALIHALNSFAR